MVGFAFTETSLTTPSLPNEKEATRWYMSTVGWIYSKQWKGIKPTKVIFCTHGLTIHAAVLAGSNYTAIWKAMPTRIGIIAAGSTRPSGRPVVNAGGRVSYIFLGHNDSYSRIDEVYDRGSRFLWLTLTPFSSQHRVHQFQSYFFPIYFQKASWD
jgi:hypothetical protein